jgi:hypothetical protein
MNPGRTLARADDARSLVGVGELLGRCRARVVAAEAVLREDREAADRGREQPPVVMADLALEDRDAIIAPVERRGADDVALSRAVWT